jgi:hypothetical protein
LLNNGGFLPALSLTPMSKQGSTSKLMAAMLLSFRNERKVKLGVFAKQD